MEFDDTMTPKIKSSIEQFGALYYDACAWAMRQQKNDPMAVGRNAQKRLCVTLPAGCRLLTENPATGVVLGPDGKSTRFDLCAISDRVLYLIECQTSDYGGWRKTVQLTGQLLSAYNMQLNPGRRAFFLKITAIPRLVRVWDLSEDRSGVAMWFEESSALITY